MIEGRDHLTNSIELADRLALARTKLAYERTFASWIRTGLASLATGIGLESLSIDQIPTWITRGIATALLLFAIFCFFAAASCERHVRCQEIGSLARLSSQAMKGASFVLGLGAAAVVVAIWII